MKKSSLLVWGFIEKITFGQYFLKQGKLNSKVPFISLIEKELY